MADLALARKVLETEAAAILALAGSAEDDAAVPERRARLLFLYELGLWLADNVSEDGPAAEPRLRVWIAVRANLRRVVEHVSLAEIAGGELPADVERLAEDPEAWITR